MIASTQSSTHNFQANLVYYISNENDFNEIFPVTCNKKFTVKDTSLPSRHKYGPLSQYLVRYSQAVLLQQISLLASQNKVGTCDVIL